jgi:hypothetical protein
VPVLQLTLLGLFLLGLGLSFLWPDTRTPSAAREARPTVLHRLPVDVVLTPDERYLLTANQT